MASAVPLGQAVAAYPDKAIRWIVPYAAGGGTDTVARLLGQAMSQKLGQPIVIENRPGGATTIGAVAAAQSRPDGYTLLSADNGTLVFNTALFQKLSYDPERDFRPIGLMARFPLILVVRPSSASTTARDLFDRAKSEPGKINYASAGIGSPHHLTMERLAREAGVQLNHVPFRGAAPALTDVIGGHVECMVVDFATGASALRAGSIRPLAICSAARHTELPNVPTVQEALDLKNFEAFAWQGLVVPRATPDAVVESLSVELAAALRQESVVSRMHEIGVEPLISTSSEMQALTEAERSVWVPLIRALGVTLD